MSVAGVAVAPRRGGPTSHRQVGPGEFGSPAGDGAIEGLAFTTVPLTVGPGSCSTAVAAPSATVGLAMRAVAAVGLVGGVDRTSEWLVHEAEIVVAAIVERVGHGCRVAAVMALLVDAGLHDLAGPGEAACCRRDAEKVVTAVTTGEVAQPASHHRVHVGPVAAALSESSRPAVRAQQRGAWC